MIYLFTLKLIDYCRDNVLTIIEEVFVLDFNHLWPGLTVLLPVVLTRLGPKRLTMTNHPGHFQFLPIRILGDVLVHKYNTFRCIN